MFTAKQLLSRYMPVLLLAIVGQLTFHSASALDESDYDYSPDELEELVGPVALYPDDLLGIILPASSYPLQIVEAARYLEKVENNPELEPDDDWDDAVVALLNYPQVIELLNEDLDWTWNLGEAVVNQQPAVLDAIQDFRGRAVATGNLETDDRQVVRQVDEVIEITPVDPEVIYVPYYDPDRVVVYQGRPVYRYYPNAYPLYYYPYPSTYRFTSGFFWGVTTAYSIGWRTDRVHFHYYGHTSHPYYGRYYTGHYKARRAGRVRHRHYAGTGSRHRYGSTWAPRHRHGNRPRRNHVRSGHRDRVAVNSSGSVRRHDSGSDRRARSGGKRIQARGIERHNRSNRRTARITNDADRVRGKRSARRVNENTTANRNTEGRRVQSNKGKHRDRRPVQSKQRGAHQSRAPESPPRQQSAAAAPTRPPQHSRKSRATRESKSSRSGQRGKRRKEYN